MESFFLYMVLITVNTTCSPSDQPKCPIAVAHSQYMPSVTGKGYTAGQCHQMGLLQMNRMPLAKGFICISEADDAKRKANILGTL